MQQVSIYGSCWPRFTRMQMWAGKLALPPGADQLQQGVKEKSRQHYKAFTYKYREQIWVTYMAAMFQ